MAFLIRKDSLAFPKSWRMQLVLSRDWNGRDGNKSNWGAFKVGD
jgi:hypothetical protein